MSETVPLDREHWHLLPGTGVGPLRFGMSPTEVAAALRAAGVRGPEGELYAREDFAGGVSVFYGDGALGCVALDAAAGPQVALDDVPLTGRDPKVTWRRMLEHAETHGNEVLFTADDSLALSDLGLLVRAQQVGETLLSRPLFVVEQWLEWEYHRDHLPMEGVPAHESGLRGASAIWWPEG